MFKYLPFPPLVQPVRHADCDRQRRLQSGNRAGCTLTISQRTPATPDQAEKQPLHIPFAIELYDNEGKVIPLQKGGHPVNSVLNVTQAEQTFVFDNVYFQARARCCANSLRQ